jgi:HEPN domain-containing protein
MYHDILRLSSLHGGPVMDNRSSLWLKQAQGEHKWAQDAFNSGNWALVCFLCQQTSEKALKAIAFSMGVIQVRSHSTYEIAESLGINGELADASRILDQYYMTTRYPDALPGGVPCEMFVRSQAQEALRLAEMFLFRARAELGDA